MALWQIIFLAGGAVLLLKNWRSAIEATRDLRWKVIPVAIIGGGVLFVISILLAYLIDWGRGLNVNIPPPP